VVLMDASYGTNSALRASIGALALTYVAAILPRGLKAAQVERELKAAEEFFELAKKAGSPFMRAYYRRVAERYLSSQGELKPAKSHASTPPAA
jgi:hypothetical protein